jgi:hypothetical protein
MYVSVRLQEHAERRQTSSPNGPNLVFLKKSRAQGSMHRNRLAPYPHTSPSDQNQPAAPQLPRHVLFMRSTRVTNKIYRDDSTIEKRGLSVPFPWHQCCIRRSAINSCRSGRRNCYPDAGSNINERLPIWEIPRFSARVKG